MARFRTEKRLRPVATGRDSFACTGRIGSRGRVTAQSPWDRFRSLFDPEQHPPFHQEVRKLHQQRVRGGALGIAKQRLAAQLGSSATHGEGAQNLLCAYLAGAVFLGLAGNALFGWWWLDPIAALLIAGVAVKEGLETWRGAGCCAAPPLDPSS